MDERKGDMPRYGADGELLDLEWGREQVRKVEASHPGVFRAGAVAEFAAYVASVARKEMIEREAQQSMLLLAVRQMLDAELGTSLAARMHLLTAPGGTYLVGNSYRRQVTATDLVRGGAGMLAILDYFNSLDSPIVATFCARLKQTILVRLIGQALTMDVALLHVRPRPVAEAALLAFMSQD